MRYFFVVLAIVFMLPQFSFAGRFDDLKDYFPMTKGSVWVYENALGEPSWKVMVTDCSDEIRGFEGCLFMEEMIAGLPKYEVFSYQGNAVLLKAGNYPDLFTEGRKQERFTRPPIVLKSPLKEGARWESYGDNSRTQYVVAKVLKRMEVKAGSFDNVLKITKKNQQQDGKTKKWKDVKNDIPVILYYAPKVGLIKEEYLGKNNSVNLFRELVEYTSGAN